MTNLLIGHNEIGLNSLNITSTNATYDSTYSAPVENLISNKKYLHTLLASAQTNNKFKYDLGYDGTSAITGTASYLAFPAHELDSDISTIALEASSDDISYSTIKSLSRATIDAGLSGYYSQDFITTFTESSAYRYWQINITASSGNFTSLFRHFYFGNLFDMGIDPDDIRVKKITPQNRFITDFGNAISQQSKKLRHQISITWQGVTDAKVLAFENMVKKQENSLLYLYAQNNDDFFSGNNLIMVNLASKSYIRQKDFNTVECTFIQADV